jgi:L-asparaginase II
VHFGAIAVVDPAGNLFAWYGDPMVETYLRSSAKPFQALPLVEMGGVERFQMTEAELAVTCASHSGTDIHLRTIYELQAKIGISKDDLHCGTHQPFDSATRALLRDRGEQPTTNHHNCSGKHTGMLGQAKLMNADLEDYTEIDHPVQQNILSIVSELCQIPVDRIQIGRDGCSVPTFSMPLIHAARGWARLSDPRELPSNIKKACQKITSAMQSAPFLVAGPGRIDTAIMQCLPGKIVSKAGAEAFQALNIPPGILKKGSPALGIVIKVADGDHRKQARRAVYIEVLKQLKLLTPDNLKALSEYGPDIPILNQRRILTGWGKPCFQLQYS